MKYMNTQPQIDNQQMMESENTEGTQGKPTELPIACAAHAPFG